MSDLQVDDGRMIEPESKTREYKRDLSNSKDAMTTVVAFANSAGGLLIIGVNDDREVVGVDDPLKEEMRLANLIADSVRPQVTPTIEIMTVSGKTILVADVALGSQRPYYLASEGPHTGTFLRLGSSDRQAAPQTVNELRRESDRVAFEQLPARNATIPDLDTDRLARALSRTVDESTLKTLGLATVEQGRIVPTNAGVVVACDHAQQFLASAYMRCARFRGTERIDIFDRKEIETFLIDAPDLVEEFLQKHAFLTAEFGDSWKRRDVWSIPMAAIRELVINAIVHASYAEYGTPIRVAFFDDHVEVENPGGLMPGITPETIIGSGSRLRNPAIARVFKEIGLMEEWGTGLIGVANELAERGLPPLEVVELPGSVRMIIRIPNHMPSIEPRPGTVRGGSQLHRADHPRASEHDPGLSEDDPGLSEHDPGLSEHDASMTPQGVAMLRVSAEHPAHRDELLQAVGLGPAYGNYKRHIAPLVDGGLLAMTAPEAPKSKNQRYKITEKGLVFLAESKRQE